ncbi:MAG: hypothetical protein L0K92_02315, partial [Enterobacterales bacterium]|nr:hypothetical protein [Enterobacterales bacterium]
LPDTGARNIDSLLNQQILPVLSQQLLQRLAQQRKPNSLTLGYNDEDGITLDFGDEESGDEKNAESDGEITAEARVTC